MLEWSGITLIRKEMTMIDLGKVSEATKNSVIPGGNDFLATQYQG